jgi:NitT/TauT family transport system ATP-binding protein
LSIELKNVSFAFQDLQVLEDISFSLAEPEVLAILGPSGCGKSTLLKLIGGLLPLVGDSLDQKGYILVDGVTASSQKGAFGFMHQKGLLLPWFTLYENLAMAYTAQDRPIDKYQIHSSLQEFGLEAFRDYYPEKLSGGMRQRGAFLRAFLFRPHSLLLDEPFGALDALTRMQLWKVIGGFFQQHPSRTLLITHSVEEALMLASRVLVLSPRPARVLMDRPLDFFQQPVLQKRDLPKYNQYRKDIEEILGLV